MIGRGLVAVLGLSQLISWGVSYYLIGVFGERMAHDLGWSITLTYGGFAEALVVMGLVSSLIGRLIDRYGGRIIMSTGSLLMALACLGLSQSENLPLYGASWACLGLAMRMTLYEAAFATLVRIGGRSARPAISQITLLGGLSSTVFWPIGHGLASQFGWRGALVGYALLALAMVPLHWSIPNGEHDPSAGGEFAAAPPLAQSRVDRMLAGALYMAVITIAAFLNSGMSTHMIGILTGLGVSAEAALWLSTLRGMGQSAARLCEVAFGKTLSPLTLCVLAAAMLPICFVAGLFSGRSVVLGACFTLAYGASSGLLTIVRGTQPLVLFDDRAYGTLIGRLTAPSFLVSALAPVAYARIVETGGYGTALYLSALLSGLQLACAVLLWWRFRSPSSMARPAQRCAASSAWKARS
ncbi:MAG: transporter [Proteobacteria bacterium]|nr:transporter [Pseudomonadota bacterium]